MCPSNLKIKLQALVVTIAQVHRFIEPLGKSVKPIMIIGLRKGTPSLSGKFLVMSLQDINVEADIETIFDLLGILVLIDIIGARSLRVNLHLKVINLIAVVVGSTCFAVVLLLSALLAIRKAMLVLTALRNALNTLRNKILTGIAMIRVARAKVTSI